MEASRRRRLVYASCQGVLSEKDCMTLVALCENQFSQVETFTPFRFFKEAQTRFNLSASLVKTLVQRFTESQKLSLEQLADPMPSSSAMTPMTAMTPVASAGTPGTPGTTGPVMTAPATSAAVGYDANKTPEQIVFEHFVGKLFAYLQIVQQPNVQNYLAKLYSTSKMPQAVKNLLMSCVQAGSFMPTEEQLTSADRISTLDMLYSSYCELYGPVQADRIFSSITSEVEMSVPEARQFSPRQFL